MADKEIYKEKVIIHDSHAHADEVPERVHEEIIRHEPERVVHEHIIHDERPARRDWRARQRARNEAWSLRRGVYLVLDIIEVILIAEFFVKLFGFNPYNPLVALIDALSYPFLAPFAGFFTPISPYFVINWSILIAMVVYALLAYLVIAVFEAGIWESYRHRH